MALLAGILRDGKTPAARAWQKCGVTLTQVRAAIAPAAASAIAMTIGSGRATARANGRGANTYGDTSATPHSAATPAFAIATPGPSNAPSGHRYFAPRTAVECISSGAASATRPSCAPTSRPRPNAVATSAITATANASSSKKLSCAGAVTTSGIAASRPAAPSATLAMRSPAERACRRPPTTREPIKHAASVPAK